MVRGQEEHVMEKLIQVKNDTLFLPVCAGKTRECLEIFCEGKKIAEFQIPVDTVEQTAYRIDFYARFPVEKFTGKTLILRGNMPELFFSAVRNEALCRDGSVNVWKDTGLRRPRIHFTAETGWINDPNGLVYKDGWYHLYFQYNPFDIAWENMCWGHAVSRDLLHWSQRETVMYPDEHGTVFSGSGIVNEHNMLGLPEDALIFFYTAAGACNKWCESDNATQRMAYSLDGGDTLVKTDWELGTICKENRDPKVFWHEESQAYIMVLWLEEHDFGILRSANLQDWELSDRITLEQAWECPDLVALQDEKGGTCWMFWSADGYYFWGDFDGCQFKTDGVRHEAYLGKLPYAAQTYAGVENRVISVPWLRLPNRRLPYTGAMGLPRELSAVTMDGKRVLAKSPVQEWRKQRREVSFSGEHTKACPGGVLELVTVLREDVARAEWNFGKDVVRYEAGTGTLFFNETSYQIGAQICDFSFLLDDVILEVTANYDTIMGVFELQEPQFTVQTEAEIFESIHLYRM